jgi:hypothetical protein
MPNVLSPQHHTLIRHPRERAPTTSYRESPGDLEFSDVGRDSRFQPGWWILPVPLFSIALIWLVVQLF